MLKSDLTPWESPCGSQAWLALAEKGAQPCAASYFSAPPQSDLEQSSALWVGEVALLSCFPFIVHRAVISPAGSTWGITKQSVAAGEMSQMCPSDYWAVRGSHRNHIILYPLHLV